MAEFKEYPKVIHCGGGTFTVGSAEEEARYRAPVKAAAKAKPVEAEPVAPVYEPPAEPEPSDVEPAPKPKKEKKPKKK